MITVLVVTIVKLALASDRLCLGLGVQRGAKSARAAGPRFSSAKRGIVVARSNGLAVNRNNGKAGDTPETMVTTMPEVTMMK